MSTQEVRAEISNILDKMNDESLHQVYKYLQTVYDSASSDTELSQNLINILKEDKEVLERLAQ